MSQPILSNIGQPGQVVVPCGKKKQYLCAQTDIMIGSVNPANAQTVGANQPFSIGIYSSVDLPVPRKAYLSAVFDLSTAVNFQVYEVFTSITATSTSTTYYIYPTYQTQNNGMTIVIPAQEMVIPPHWVNGNNAVTIVPSSTVSIVGATLYYVETPIEDVGPAV